MREAEGKRERSGIGAKVSERLEGAEIIGIKRKRGEKGDIIALFKTERLVKELSELKMNTIHMCKNLCCTFDGPFSARDQCPFCKHAWRNRKGIPYKIFQPIPLTPCLQAMYANPNMVKAMRYCANYHHGSEDEQPERTEEPEHM